MACDPWEKPARTTHSLGHCFFSVLSKAMSFLAPRAAESKYSVDGIVESKSRELIGVFCKVWGSAAG